MNYEKPGLRSISYDFDNAQPLDRTEAYMTLSRKDVLGIVQSAFDEIGLQGSDLNAVKQAVLEEVAEGKLAHALRLLGREKRAERNARAGSCPVPLRYLSAFLLCYRCAT